MLQCFGLCSESAGFAGPMLRQQILERRKAPLPLPRPDGRADSHQKGDACYSTLLAESHRVVEPWAQPARQTCDPNDGIGIDFGDSKRVLATLLFQRIRPRNHPVADAKEPGRARAPGLPSPRPRQPRPPVTIARQNPSDSASIETIFTELARRWLRRLAAEERPL
jgi:hypothetical protein